MKRKFSLPNGIVCLLVILVIFGYLASVMGLSNMLNTMMHTAHDLLINTVFYIMAICVLTGALAKIFIDFGVVDLFQKLLRPIMKPLFNLPGVASLGAVMTFLSDNPAIISLAQDRKFAKYFKKYQLISLTNFGTAFGMGLIVIVFMIGQGYFLAPLVGLGGAMIGCIISTRLMQYFVCKDHPDFRDEDAITEAHAHHNADGAESEAEEDGSSETGFVKVLNALLDGGKSGVDIGLAIIPGVLVISTFVMMITFGGSTITGADGNAVTAFTGAAYEGTRLLPWLAGKIDFVFQWLFGFHAPELIAFPITALGAVGAALGLIPEFVQQGIIDGNAIAVFTAMGMCWSGYLSTHTAMLDSLGFRNLLSRAFISHFIGGIGAGVCAHWLYVGIVALAGLL
ncbi:MAG: nucleoside recognition domain-containing protein [Candidatus Cryptobacteroides sp.]